MYNQPKRFMWLWEKGVRSEHVDKNGYTALHWASRNGNIAMIETLVQENNNVDIADSTGLSPLIHASIFGEIEAAKILIKNGADINFKQGVDGLSPVLVAAINDQVDMLTFLLDEGADPQQTWRGTTAFDCALPGQYTRILKLLISCGALRNENNDTMPEFIALQQAALINDLAGLQNYLQPLSGNQKMLAMESAISAAAAGGAQDVVSWLCEQGVKTGFIGGNGRTALHMAIQGKHFDIAQKLIDSGHDPALPDYYDSLPVHSACVRHGGKAKDIVVSLFQNGGLAPPATNDVLDATLPDRLFKNWSGHYTYADWQKGRKDNTSFSLKPYEYTPPTSVRGLRATTPQLPFYDESADEIGSFEIYGQMLTATKFAFIKLYGTGGWLYHGEISADGKTLSGTWGSSPQLWHGTFEVSSAGES